MDGTYKENDFRKLILDEKFYATNSVIAPCTMYKTTVPCLTFIPFSELMVNIEEHESNGL